MCLRFFVALFFHFVHFNPTSCRSCSARDEDTHRNPKNTNLDIRVVVLVNTRIIFSIITCSTLRFFWRRHVTCYWRNPETSTMYHFPSFRFLRQRSRAVDVDLFFFLKYALFQRHALRCHIRSWNTYHVSSVSILRSTRQFTTLMSCVDHKEIWATTCSSTVHMKLRSSEWSPSLISALRHPRRALSFWTDLSECLWSDLVSSLE